jgi:hypothetical protein
MNFARFSNLKQIKINFEMGLILGVMRGAL